MAKKIRPAAKFTRTETRVIRKEGRFCIQRRKIYGFEESWSPVLDISEANGRIIIYIEVPGVPAEDITIIVHPNLVVIKGIKAENLSHKEIRFFRMECEHGAFHRSIFLPGLINPGKARAVLENGVLTITLTKI